MNRAFRVRKATPEKGGPLLMSVVRLSRLTSKEAPQARGDDVDRGADLSYNGGRSVLPDLSMIEGSPAEGL